MIPPAVYQHFVRPILFCLDPETAHHLSLAILKTLGPIVRRFMPRRDRRLERTVFGVTFPNPVGLAAGFDKNAVALAAWEVLGFGFAEVGTITARAQPGNPRPRIFRIPESAALINRMGFNNNGCDEVAVRLRKLRQGHGWPRIPIGINIGKSKVTPINEAVSDYLLSFERLHAFADYVVINVSSPNTPGLRALQDRRALDELLGAIQGRNPARTPLLVKIAPDLTGDDIEDILALAEEHRLAGIVATNTTIDHSAIAPSRRTEGGMSGWPLRERSTEIIRFISSRSNIPIIASGGVFDADSALEKLDAGASLIQLYTGFVYNGPALIQHICDALRARGG